MLTGGALRAVAGNGMEGGIATNSSLRQDQSTRNHVDGDDESAEVGPMETLASDMESRRETDEDRRRRRQELRERCSAGSVRWPHLIILEAESSVN